jgi:vacuolar-type H+-ATPase subunit I/STV1
MAISGAPRPRTPSPELPAVEEAHVGPLDADWPRQATEQVVKVVDNVRDKTTGPVLDASRWFVYGLVAMVAGAIIGVLAVIGAIRLLDVVLPRGVWLAYLVLGLLFTLAGTICWSKREVRARA